MWKKHSWNKQLIGFEWHRLHWMIILFRTLLEEAILTVYLTDFITKKLWKDNYIITQLQGSTTTGGLAWYSWATECFKLAGSQKFGEIFIALTKAGQWMAVYGMIQ